MNTAGNGFRLTSRQAEEAWDALKRDFQIIAPVNKKGQGRFSGTDLITYDQANSLSEIEFGARTYFSAKGYLLPIRETLFSFPAGETPADQPATKPLILFLRSCDIQALRVFDAIFLTKGGYQDNYYQQRRNKIKIFLIECAEPFPGCYCVSLGTNRTNDYAVFLRPVEAGLEVKINDDHFAEYFKIGETDLIEPDFVEQDARPLKIPDQIETSSLSQEMWREYSARCLACGRCNTSCPTCTCFTVQDLIADSGTKSRRRIWSACQVKDFSLLAGHHDFRQEYGDRLRYRVLHKISDFKKRFGFHMCVGCGRCDDVCPTYISMFKSIEKLNQLQERAQANA